MSAASVSWILIKALHNTQVFSVDKYFLILLRACSLELAWRQIGFQCVPLTSAAINCYPKHTRALVSWIPTELSFKVFLLRFFFPQTWNFLGLPLIEMILNLFKIIFISGFNLLIMSEMSWPQLNKIVSSAKLQIYDFSIKSDRSLIKILKRRSPNINLEENV